MLGLVTISGTPISSIDEIPNRYQQLNDTLTINQTVNGRVLAKQVLSQPLAFIQSVSARVLPKPVLSQSLTLTQSINGGFTYLIEICQCLDLCDKAQRDVRATVNQTLTINQALNDRQVLNQTLNLVQTVTTNAVRGRCCDSVSYVPDHELKQILELKDSVSIYGNKTVIVSQSLDLLQTVAWIPSDE